MIATVASRTGIAPLALRDCALEDADLLEAVVHAADEWTPELELAAASLEVSHETLRVVLAIGGAKVPPPLAVPRRRELPTKRRAPVVSIEALAAMTNRPIARAD